MHGLAHLCMGHLALGPGTRARYQSTMDAWGFLEFFGEFKVSADTFSYSDRKIDDDESVRGQFCEAVAVRGWPQS